MHVHTSLCKQLVVLLYVGLLVIDGFPLLVVVVGILVHLLYGSLLTTFPLISPCSPGFLGGSGEQSGHFPRISLIMCTT